MPVPLYPRADPPPPADRTESWIGSLVRFVLHRDTHHDPKPGEPTTAAAEAIALPIRDVIATTTVPPAFIPTGSASLPPATRIDPETIIELPPATSTEPPATTLPLSTSAPPADPTSTSASASASTSSSTAPAATTAVPIGTSIALPDPQPTAAASASTDTPQAIIPTATATNLSSGTIASDAPIATNSGAAPLSSSQNTPSGLTSNEKLYIGIGGGIGGIVLLCLGLYLFCGRSRRRPASRVEPYTLTPELEGWPVGAGKVGTATPSPQRTAELDACAAPRPTDPAELEPRGRTRVRGQRRTSRAVAQPTWQETTAIAELAQPAAGRAVIADGSGGVTPYQGASRDTDEVDATLVRSDLVELDSQELAVEADPAPAVVARPAPEIAACPVPVAVADPTPAVEAAELPGAAIFLNDQEVEQTRAQQAKVEARRRTLLLLQQVEDEPEVLQAMLAAAQEARQAAAAE